MSRERTGPEFSGPGGTKKQPEIRLNVSSDGMEAMVWAAPARGEREVPAEEILKALAENRIVFGVDEEGIREACRSGGFAEGAVCARGLRPADEERGRLEFLFEREKSMKPAEREDGTVDYRDLGIVQNVKKGEALCRLIPPKPGRDGRDVFGRAVPFRRGALPPLPQGRNTELSADGRTLTAAIDGCVEYKNALVCVNDVFLVRGDVGSASGNIDAVGTVVVRGDVRDGFSIRAVGDINVRGMVEGARLEAGGSIAITLGMNGMHRGSLKAGGSVSAKYLENTAIECGGDVRTDVILNSAVRAGGSVFLAGHKALISGSRCTAGRQIAAKTIGSGGSRTEVAILSENLNRLLAGRVEQGDPKQIRAALAEMKKKEKTLGSQIGMIARFRKKDAKATADDKLLIRLARQRERLAAGIKKLEEKLARLEASGVAGQTALDYKIVALEVIRAGTKMTIGTFSQTLTADTSSMKFYAGGDRIVASPLSPSERIYEPLV